MSSQNNLASNNVPKEASICFLPTHPSAKTNPRILPKANAFSLSDFIDILYFIKKFPSSIISVGCSNPITNSVPFFSIILDFKS